MTGVTVSTALRLSKFFGQPSTFWFELQQQADMQAASDNKELQTVLKNIKKVPTAAKQKSTPKVSNAKKAKSTPKK